MQVNDFFEDRYISSRWRCNSVLVNKIALAFGMACLTGLAAQIKIFIPWTPVPITGQTFAVLLVAVFLGKWWGGISQAMYVLLGVAGIPWFAGWSGGCGALIGPRGGYIIGFVLAALFIGYMTDKYPQTRRFLPLLGLMIFANFVLIHLPGLLQLGLWSYMVQGDSPTFLKLFWMGSLPFIAGDVIKVVSAAAVAKTMLPKISM